VGNILLHAFPKPLWLLETAPIILAQGVYGVNIRTERTEKTFPCFNKENISRIKKLEFLMMYQLRMNENVETRREN
jgi:hypothetical protein